MKQTVMLVAILTLLGDCFLRGQPIPVARPEPIRIGILAGPIPHGPVVFASFKNAMSRLGYVEGRQVVYEQRVRETVGTMGAVGLTNIISGLASQLVEARVQVLVATGSTEALAAMKVAGTIPIVFWSSDPVEEGLVKSLQRPGTTATGLTAETSGVAEQLETIRELVPGVTRIAVLNNPSYLPGRGVLARTQRGANSIGLRVDTIEVLSPDDLQAAFTRAEKQGCQAILLTNHGMFRSAASRLAQLALQHRLPLFSPYDELAEAGALIAWTPSFIRWSELAAEYVDHILRGANPATMPVAESVPFLYSVNLRTAQALGIIVPEELLRRADRVIRPAETESANAELETAFNQLSAAMVKNDLPALDLLWADNYVMVNERGGTANKQQRIASLKSGELKYVSIEHDSVHVRTEGTMGFVTWGGKTRVLRNGEEQKLPYTKCVGLFSKTTGRWQAEFVQCTAALEPERK